MPKTPFLSRVLNKAAKIDRELLHDYLLEVAEERDFLKVIFDSMVEGVVALDEEGRVLFMNTSASTLFSAQREGIKKAQADEIIQDADLLELIENCLKTNDRILDYEIQINIPRERNLNVNIIPLIDRSQRFAGMIVLLYDITNRKKNEARLRHAQKLASLTTLAAGMAHEIRNPLNALSIHLEILTRAVKDQMEKPEVSESLGVIREEIDRLNHVIEDFLTVVKPQAANWQEKSVGELIEETLNTFGPEIREHGVEVEIIQDGEQAMVLGDPMRLKSAVTNLIRNAIEAMSKKGKLSITIHGAIDLAQIIFSDTGVGIEPENLKKIFDPYYTTKAEGTGLGLMMVEKVIREHGGSIKVLSEPDKGTTVIVTLPTVKGQPRLLTHTHKNE